MAEKLISPSSYWLGDAPARSQFPQLSGEQQTQVAIIGGGISGLSTALELLQRGFQVTVCESSVIGAGTTAGSTGHLDAHSETGHRPLIKRIGVDDARQVIRVRSEAIDLIENRSDAACDFKRLPAYQYSESEDDTDSLRDDCEAAAELGLDVQWEQKPPLALAACGYRVNRMGRFHSAHYLRRLTQLVLEKGGQIFEHTLVEGPADTHPDRLPAGKGHIRFDHVVSAVHSGYAASNWVYLQTPPYQSYVLAARLRNPPPDALWWDNAEPYHYIRKANSSDENLYIIGGCDHHTGGGDELAAQSDLETYTRERFDVFEIVCRWSAELFEPLDGLPIIGKVPQCENVWIVTGLSGVGLTWGTAAGRLLAQQIAGEESILADRIAPGRFGLKQAAKMVTEHTSAAASYAERVLPTHSIDPQSLAPGEGRVGKVDGKHVAVCRDAHGQLHQRSPICVHMGGVVRWNPVEQTWDCPVHGGRYTSAGCRLYGPPSGDLEDP
jgi:glycine/D-amino acid oxidase-like deaminating enzyme/nitrite reductase/ring-hydroxylating ferredoxin subunit